MKRLIPAFVLLNTLFVNAQSKDVQMQWADSYYTVGENAYFIPSFQQQMLRYDAAKKVLGASVVINQVNGNGVRIVSQKLQTIDVSKYADLNAKNIPTTIDEKITFYVAKGKKSAVVNFNPIIKTASGYSKITEISFEITNNTGAFKYAAKDLIKSNSVLATGNWFKFKLNDTGVYKLSKKFLTDLGIPENVDPRTIKIYGYGGDMLPIVNEKNLNFDLPELAIQFNGEQDGSLDDTDYALFYGIGIKGWNAENATHLNLYSKDAFYYVTYGSETGKRMNKYIEPTSNSNEVFTDFIARVFIEEDQTNLTQLSRKWFGKNFNETANGRLSFTLQTPFLNSTKPLTIGTNVALVSTNGGFFNLSLNDQAIGAINLNGKNGSSLAFEGYLKKEINSASESNTIHIDFNNNGVPTARGFVDFVAIDYYKHLVGYNKQFKFSFPTAVTNVGTASFKINNAQNLSQVWNVTDVYNPTYISNAANTFEVKFQMGTLEEFVAVDVNDYLTPVIIPNSKVANQDLKGTIFKDGNVDYLIITNNNLLAAAQRLAVLHKAKNNLNVKVIPLDVIYNEFSSGQQDVVAVRNFIRYVYQAGNQTLKYVNLFGDASTDYLDRIQNNSNQVPIFHTLDNTLHSNSSSNFNDQSSFGSDDFYALLDDGEEIKFWGDHLGLDVAIGRIPVNTIQEANNVVNKIEEYLSSDNSGRWKNNYTALADDVDNTFDVDLQITLNNMVDELVKNKPYFNVKKVIADSYQQQVVAGGPRYPKAKEDFLNGINNGSLVVNYLGHGSETLLGQEQFLDLNDVDQLKNEGKYPLFAIITCDFTRFDNPLLKSGGERLFLRDKAGAIGIMATTRKIGISHAQEFTTNLSAWLFDYTNSQPEVSMAEALMLTKNDTQKPVSEKGVVAFIGDPALKLAVPKPDIAITHVNNEPIQNFTGSLRALDRIILKGNVTNESGQVVTNFNGNLAVQLFDKNIEKTTLLNDKGGYGPGIVIDPMKFTTLGETFFRGNATVINGVFEIEFVVPKDIKIAVGEGKVSFYAKKEATVLDDYTGANTTIKVGGVNENAQEDNKAPQIKLFMNDESFISGGITNNAPLFLAHLEDENGMNTASGIGHDMIAILDGDENNPIVMNEFYETEPNNFMKGFVNYPFSNLKEGLHTISFKAWDAYNNLATATLDFVVAASTGLQLDKVLNYPNPFVDYTEFWFQHNRPNETLQVQVQILTVTGKIVRTINQTVVSQGILSKEIKWDGRDDFGDKIGKGVYIYKLKVKATESGQEAEKFEKLVIL